MTREKKFDAAQKRRWDLLSKADRFLSVKMRGAEFPSITAQFYKLLYQEGQARVSLARRGAIRKIESYRERQKHNEQTAKLRTAREFQAKLLREARALIQESRMWKIGE